MIIPYEKILSNFPISWDMEHIEQYFSEEVSGLDNVWGTGKSDNTPHWQYYTAGAAGIRVSRNFSLNFKNECMEIIIKLKQLQDKLRKETYRSPLLDIFLNKQFTYDSYKAIHLLKTSANGNISPHIDPRRSIALNIGLKNSNACETIFSNIIKEKDVLDFEKADHSSFIMEDGDVYLMSVNNAHRVKSLSKDRDRYIITLQLA